MAAAVVVLQEEGPKSYVEVKFYSGKMPAEKCIIPVCSRLLAARPTEAVLFHASHKIAQNLAFVLFSFGCNTFRKTFLLKIRM